MEQSINQEKRPYQTASRQNMMKESQTLDQAERQSSNKLGYIDKGSGEHQSNQVFNKKNICPTVHCTSWKQPLKIVDDNEKRT